MKETTKQPVQNPLNMQDIMYQKIIQELSNKPKEVQEQINQHLLQVFTQMDIELRKIPSII